MKKIRYITLALVLCLLALFALPLTADAATVVDQGKLGDFAEWTLTDDGTLTVTGRYQITPYYIDLLRNEHEQDIRHLVVKIDHRDIHADLTMNLPNLVSVDMSQSTLETIEANAFCFCPNLETVILPDTLREIQNNTFSYCEKLQHITFPTGLEAIGEMAFFKSGLTSISLPGSIASIGKEAFAECEQLRTLNTQDGLGSIGAQAFRGCINLGGHLYLPPSVDLGFRAFEGCTGFESVEMHISVPDDMFLDNVDLTSAKILGDATFISHNAFSGCTNLSEVVLGPNMKELGNDAFRNCTALTEIILPEGLTTLLGSTFAGSGLREITFPSTLTDMRMSSFANCQDLISVDFSNVTALEEIGNFTFSGCSSLTTVDTGSLKVIGGGAFANCASLSTIRLSENLERIEQEAFEGCTSLTEMVLPDSLITLSQNSFLDCTSLDTLIIKENIQNMSSSVVAGCTALTNFTIYSMDLEFDRVTPAIFADCPNVTIYCYSGSTAETYALEHGIPLMYLDGGGHNFDEGVVTTPAACYVPGVMTFTCIDCGETLTTTIPALEHDFSGTPVYDAANRRHDRSCTRCDVSTTDFCTFDGGAVTTEATLTHPGVTTYTCTVCGGSYNEEFICRIYGSNRYETGFSAADMLKTQLGVDEFGTIIVASGLDFADALTGSYLAAVKSAPILLVNQHFMDEAAAYINENLSDGGKVYLLGGELAVSPDMETMLPGIDVERLAGANRLETNLKILEEAGVGDEEILVCYSHGFADSLSASAVGKPILMVNRGLTDAQKEFLATTSGKFVIIGGTTAVSEAIEAQLQELGTTERIGGANRYETSTNVAKRFFENPRTVVLAYGANFPDGLCGGPLAYSVGAPLILTRDVNAQLAAVYTLEYGITYGAVLGGPTLISDGSVNTILHR